MNQWGISVLKWWKAAMEAVTQSRKTQAHSIPANTQVVECDNAGTGFD